MDESPIRGEIRTLDFASDEPSEEFDYDAAFAGAGPDSDIDWSRAEPQFTEEATAEFGENGTVVIDFPQAHGAVNSPPVVVNREELIFLSASLGAGQLDVALTLPEAAAIFDALGEALVSGS